MRQHDDGPQLPFHPEQAPPDETRKVLVVDDYGQWLDSVVEMLARAGYDVRGARDFRSGQLAVEEFEPDVLIVDIRLEQYNGLQLVLLSRERHPDTVALVVSGYEDPVLMSEAEKAGAYDFLLKPIPADVLIERVGAALTSRGKRRWPRRQAPPGFMAIVAGHPARIRDVSYGGILMELPFVPQVEPLDVRVPTLDRSVTAKAVWTRGQASGMQLCGVALKMDEDVIAAWRQVVDRMPSPA